jgi:hypothetical protein
MIGERQLPLLQSSLPLLLKGQTKCINNNNYKFWDVFFSAPHRLSEGIPAGEKT